MVTTAYQPRLVDSLLTELLADHPALLITGPRATGKTTTAARFAAGVVHLDRPAEAAAFIADPDAALHEQREPLLIDEWQEVPAVLGAVKRAVDAEPRPGRFVLTGSVRADLQAPTWPGTGRLVRVQMYGMTVRELVSGARRTPFIDLVAAGKRTRLPAERPTLPDYVRLALAGGFPEPALRLREPAMTRWLESYIDQLLTRDVAGIAGERDPLRLRRFFEAYSMNTAGTVSDTTLFEAAGINRKTGNDYERLLANLFIVEALPAWTTNRLKRLSQRPKRYVLDPSIVRALLRLDSSAALRDGDVLGRLLDTFVVAQLRAEVGVCETRPRLYHLREEHGRYEVDLVAELSGGHIIAFEIKADAAPDRSSAKHLVWLRDQLGDRFIQGIVLHTGPAIFKLDDRISAIPICAIWGP